MFTLIDLFSKLYNQVQTTPKYRLIFLLSEAGSLLNFQGTKKWLELNLEDNSQIQNAEFVICLDSLSHLTSETGKDIYMHVSKPPKDGSHVKRFVDILQQKAKLYGGENNKTVETIHKKINLAEQFLAWEHERYSMKRIAAFTLSSLESYTDPIRTTIFSEHTSKSTLQDSVLDKEILDNLQINTKILAETLAAYIFNINIDSTDEAETGEIFTGTMAIKPSNIQPYLGLQSMSKSNNIKLGFEKYLKNVKQFTEKPDPREPDFMFYDGEEAKLNIYK